MSLYEIMADVIEEYDAMLEEFGIKTVAPSIQIDENDEIPF